MAGQQVQRWNPDGDCQQRDSAGRTVDAALATLASGQLWLLESGNGTFGRVDLQRGRYEPVASLPGFTRGIDFFGRYAFIGLSQVRESAIFSGIPIAERPVSERSCGVWVVDIVTGETVAWLKFDDGVQEIFAVAVLPDSRCPDVINDQPEVISDSFILPDESLSSVPDDIRFVTETSTTDERSENQRNTEL